MFSKLSKMVELVGPLQTTIFSTYITYKMVNLSYLVTSHNLCNNLDAGQLHRGRRTHQRQDPP